MAIGILSLIGTAIGTIGEIGKSWMERKKVKAEGKVRIEQAKVEGKVKQIQTLTEGNLEYDKIAAEGMRYSWKDEWFVVILSCPVIMCFIPGLDVYALKGFKILSETPEWYRWAFLGAIVASFGLKGWFNGFKGFKK